jgi:hypothetical protein
MGGGHPFGKEDVDGGNRGNPESFVAFVSIGAIFWRRLEHDASVLPPSYSSSLLSSTTMTAA